MKLVDYNKFAELINQETLPFLHECVIENETAKPEYICNTVVKILDACVLDDVKIVNYDKAFERIYEIKEGYEELSNLDKEDEQWWLSLVDCCKKSLMILDECLIDEVDK